MHGFRVLIAMSALVTAALPATAVAGAPSPFADAQAVGDARLAAERGRGADGGVVVITGNTIINDGLRESRRTAAIEGSFNGSRGVVTAVQNLGDQVNLQITTNVTVNVY